jgi:DNA-binding MarR family transcriptional regulator
MSTTGARKGGGLVKSDYERLAHFRYQLRRFLRFSEEVTRKHGVTALQYLLLLQIQGFPRREWATVGELAERLQAKHHGVGSLISRCEELGLVTRSTSRSDRRRVEVKLTRKGEECVERLARLHRDELLSLGTELVVPDLREIANKPRRAVGVSRVPKPTGRGSKTRLSEKRVQEGERGV